MSNNIAWQATFSLEVFLELNFWDSFFNGHEDIWVIDCDPEVYDREYKGQKHWQ